MHTVPASPAPQRSPVAHLARRARRGFSLVEIITALTILGIIGVALTKLVLGQTRSFQHENAGRRARSTARSAMNIMITDLRMTQDIGGVDSVDAVNHRWVDVKVPIAFGIVCEVNATNAVLALVAVDSFQMASSKYGGWALRNKTTSQYTYQRAGASDTISTVAANACRVGLGVYADTARIGGRTGAVVQVTPAPPAGAAVGDAAFIFQHVRYQFAASQIYNGRVGLWRRIRGRANTDSLREELIAPFASTARFAYYTNPSQVHDTAAKTAPGSMDRIRGFQIYLPAESSDTVPGRTAPQRANTTTAVFFKNTRVQ
jgi:prepilin-type N-terminal cleavage/methylation domain-containing protein